MVSKLYFAHFELDIYRSALRYLRIFLTNVIMHPNRAASIVLAKILLILTFLRRCVNGCQFLSQLGPCVSW